jgi:putative MATE family efflux protein
MVLSNMLQSLSGTVNGIYMGQLLGVGALAAVSAFFPILFFFIAFVIGLGAGASVLIGQAWGAQKIERVKAIAGTALTAGTLFGLGVAVLGGGLIAPLLGALGTPADILPDAVRYARIMLFAAPGLFVFLLMTSMLRGVGDTVSPLLALLLSTCVGLVTTPALIQGWLGLPRLGVASAAWASLLSYLVATAWLAWRLKTRLYRGQPHPLAPDAVLWGHLRMSPGIVKGILRIGVPTGLQMVVISLSEVSVLGLVNGFGSQATAAYGAVNQIVSYVQFPAISIAITCSILGAQAIGAGHTERLGRIVRTGLIMNLAITGGLVLLGYLFSGVMIGLFIQDQAVVAVAQTLLHTMLWSLIIMGMSGAVSGVMRASGTVLVPTCISIGCILLVQIPVAWAMSRSIGLNGVWIGYPAAFVSMLVLQTAYYRLVWRKRPIKKLV